MIPDKTEVIARKQELLQRLECKYKGVCNCVFPYEVYCDSLKHLKCTEYQIMNLTEKLNKGEFGLKVKLENFKSRKLRGF